MNDPAEQALAYLREVTQSSSSDDKLPVTINFHPDLAVHGRPIIEHLGAEGVYRSQFETGTSSGGLSAHSRGDRWNWESRIFNGAYDRQHPSARPKYGALNHRGDPTGGSRRFGSAHLRLRPHVRSRTSFCYPDSHLDPRHFAAGDIGALLGMANENALSLDPWLDNYVEAHIHGPLVIAADVEALVLDPSFKETRIGEVASSIGCTVEWHDGFCLSLDLLDNCRVYRGEAAADAIAQIAKHGFVTPASLWRARETALDYQTAKWVWHCIARFGHV